MSNTILLKRSSVQNKAPLVSDLSLGELGINTYDGKLYLRKNNGVDSIVDITGNETITVSGDVTGSGSTAITLTLANSGVSAGSYSKVTVDTKGRVTAGSAIASADVTTALGFTPYNATNPNGYTSNLGTVTSFAFTNANGFTGTVSTATTTPTLSLSLQNASATQAGQLSSTDWATFNSKQAGNANLTSVAALSTSTTGLIKFTNGVASLDTNTYITAATAPVTSVAGRTGAIVLTSADVGLGNVNNTSDANKPVSTATQTALNLKVDASQLGVASGVATLDATGKLLTAQIPSALLGATVYQGVWNASTNTPTLVSGTGTKGQYYKVSVAGTTSIDGNANWTVGDIIIYNGTTWDAIQGGTSDVSSVFGRVGAVTLLAADVTTALGFTPYNATNPNGYITAAGAPVQSVAGRTGTVVLTSADVGLGNVNNTSDANKPVSTAQQSALDAKQPLLSGTGFVKSTAGVITYDTTTYLTGNQSITISGDATGSGTTAITLTLASSGVTAGTYKSVTVDAKGRVTAGTNPTTIAGFGITDAVSTSSTIDGGAF